VAERDHISGCSLVPFVHGLNLAFTATRENESMTIPIVSRHAGRRSSRRKVCAKTDFCNLTGRALEHFSKIARLIAHPSGSIIFKEGDPADGIFLVCDGQVKLSATAPGGHTMILKIARPGDVLGLSSMLNYLPHEVTAQTLVPCHFKHITQQLFLSFLEAYAEAGYMTALTLAKENREVFMGTRRLALSPSAAARIAQVLIGFAHSDAAREPAPRFPMMLTHAELASLAGTSRETVTRLLNQFERNGIISRDDSLITIVQFSQLEQLAH
jgi:CRP/FNR family transcriptional regulator, cyclic AMP receptor protein